MKNSKTPIIIAFAVAAIAAIAIMLLKQSDTENTQAVKGTSTTKSQSLSLTGPDSTTSSLAEKPKKSCGPSPPFSKSGI